MVVNKRLLKLANGILYQVKPAERFYQILSVDGGERIFGEELRSIRFFDWVHPDDKDYLRKAFKKCCEKESGHNIRHRIVGSNGEVSFVSNSFYYENKVEKGTVITGMLILENQQCGLSKINQKLATNLKEKKKEVDELSVALKTILRTIDQEKQSLKDNISIYIESSILPIINVLKRKYPSESKFDVIQNNLKNLLDSQNKKLFLVQNGLTSKEIEICYQLVQGLGGKEIAINMDISYLTLRTHTKNIRKKLSLSRSQNLSLYLQEHLSGHDFSESVI